MSKKIIGIDVYSALHYPRGMGIYTINFVKELLSIDKINEYILYSDVEDKNNIFPNQNNVKFKVLKSKGLFHYEQFVLPKQAKIDKIDILHSPANTSPIFLDTKIKRLLSLHDVMFLKKDLPLPNNKKQLLGRMYYSLTTLLSAHRAVKILTPSKYSKEDISKTLHINNGKILVDTRGADHFETNDATNFETLHNKYNIPHEYFFQIGGEAPNKNTEILLKLFSKHSELSLVVAGIKNLDNSLLYSKYKGFKNIVFVPYISQEDIVGLYKNAKAFIFPSIYEGFGLPILEAIKCNCPLICSNASCLPEVAGDCALYFNPHDENDIYEKILEIKNHQIQSELKSHYSERLSKFSWANTAKTILDVYNSF